jgi:hypothetical protein
MVTVPVKVGEAIGAKAVLVKALEPRVPPAPMFRVEVSVPARVRVLETVKVFDVVPPAMVKPVPAATRVKPLTEVGVIAPKVRVIAGVVVAVATEPETPLAVTTETEVTVPPPVGIANVPSPRRNVVVLFGGVGTAPPTVAVMTGRSAPVAIESTPVVVVFFTIPVPRAPRNCAAESPASTVP